MPELCQTDARNVPEYDRIMPEICQKYARNYAQNMPELFKNYIRIMP